jgi:hypothetical protein
MENLKRSAMQIYGLKDRIISREKGVFLPLGAAIFLGVFVWVIVVGANTMLVKYASAKLKKRNDQICQALVANHLFAVEGHPVLAFSELFKSEFKTPIFGDRVTITRAWLVIPTMPVSGGGSEDGLPFNAYDYDSKERQVGNGAGFGIPFEDFTDPLPVQDKASCKGIAGTNNTNLDCSFFGTVFDRNIVTDADEIDKYFPHKIWTNDLNANNTAGCILEGTVETFFSKFFSQEPTISAATAYWKPVRGHFIDPEDDTIELRPSLTVAIAPHMTTESTDVRFRFPDDLEGPPEDPPPNAPLFEWSAPSDYDPLAEFSPGTLGNVGLPDPSPGETPFIDTAAGFGAGDGRNFYETESMPTPDLTGDDDEYYYRAVMRTHYRVYNPPRISPYEESAVWEPDKDDVPGQYEEILGLGNHEEDGTDYEQMVTACMNPAVLVRNAFLVTIAQMAAKHGSLRNRTDYLIVGTQHQMPEGDYDDTYGPGGVLADGLRKGGADLPAPYPNPPTMLGPFGFDSLRPDYMFNVDTYGVLGVFEHPYVSFFSAYNDAPHVEDGVEGKLDLDRFGPDKRGWIYPFLTQPSDFSDPASMSLPNLSDVKCRIEDEGDVYNYCPHQSVIANQLRSCQFLYNNKIIVKPPYPKTLVHTGLIDSSDYEMINNLIPDDNEGWDLECAWGALSWIMGNDTASETCFCWDAGGGAPALRPKKGGLIAFEIMSSLGTIQTCPYRQYVDVDVDGFENTDGTYPPDPPDFICQKPGYDVGIVNGEKGYSTRDDLRPDYEGLLRFLTRDSTVDIDCIRRPGMWSVTKYDNFVGDLKYDVNSRPSNEKPFDQRMDLYGDGTSWAGWMDSYRDSYSKTVGSADDLTMSPLLLVTHRPPIRRTLDSNGNLDDAAYFDEVEAINKLLTDGDWAKRPITIVFIPTTRYDHIEMVRFLNAFGILYTEVLGDGITAFRHNRMILLSPFNPRETGFPDLEGTKTDAEIFQKYWLELILPHSTGGAPNIEYNRSIYHRAERVFNELLTTTQRKY